MTDCNCLNCHYRKLNYAADGYSYVVECPLSDTPRPLAAASKHTCKHHFRDGLIVVPYSSISRYIVNYLADRFHRSTEGIGPNSRLSEFPISAGELTNVLAHAFAVTIPETKYSRWKTLEQAINATYSAQYSR